MFLKKLKTRIDSMSRPAFRILQISFFCTYLFLLCALTCAVRIYLSGGAAPRSLYTALGEYLRMPQASLLIGVLGSGVAEEKAAGQGRQ